MHPFGVEWCDSLKTVFGSIAAPRTSDDVMAPPGKVLAQIPLSDDTVIAEDAIWWP